MRVTKEQLGFLKEYVAVSDTSSVLGDKLKIKVKNGEVIYAQQSKDAFLITKVSAGVKEEFELLVQTKMFWDFLNTINDTDELIITQEGINLGEDKHYTFESYDLEFPDLDSLYSKVETASKSPDTFSFDFNDYDKLSIVSKYCGKDSLETIGFMKDKLLATDRVQIAYVEGSLNFPKNYFFGKPAINLMLSQKGKSQVRVNLTESFYYFTIDKTLCIFEWKQFGVPDLFSEQAYSKFSQSDKVTMNRSELLSALTRMSFFVFNNPSNRIFLTIKEDHVLIENRDFNKSFEKVYLVEKNKSLEEVTIILNNKNLLSFVNSLSESEVSFYINKDSSNRATIRVEDSKHDYKFVHVLLKSE